MSKFIPSLSVCCLTLLVAACAHRSTVTVIDTSTLPGLIAMGNTGPANARGTQSVGKIREMALKETALSLGAQSGLAWRACQINDELTRQQRTLDAVYDFNSLILENNILPPVLLEGRNTLNLADLQTIRVSDRVYKVSKQAHFVTTPPTWRQYLWMDYKKPETPHVSLLPKCREERAIWVAYIEKGWKNGVDQANTILEESVARIKEDFSGMILYRKLLAMNMVSPPFVSHTELGVTGDASEIHIDDRVLRITALPGLNINSKEWRAAVEKDENALEQFKNMDKLAQNTNITVTSKAWQPVIAPVN
ncbi:MULTISPECIES: type IV secretion system DotC family protein [Legionella]|uniref:type IV secretion system DotC family protein n=1 Tax=Legionella TaxID=445 RepID=UPI00073133F1|nr:MULTISPECIES: type IV secretion system DotC family protein [Legionella]MCE3043631.1 type IV secretion system DotC family protein [Legionella sp. 16cNR16C]MCW8449866.1 type IV secretion system DotC family protein [Legionella quinlivanii]